MEHRKLTFVGRLALTAAASDAFAQGPPVPRIGRGLTAPPMGGGLPGLPMGGGPDGGAPSPRGRRTLMKVRAIGLLSIIALGSGNLTGSGNELKYNPPARIILVECDQNAMQIYRQQWNYCSDICVTGDAQSQQTCWTGCVNRYNHCGIASNCR